jgi:hypothetical protein
MWGSLGCLGRWWDLPGVGSIVMKCAVGFHTLVQSDDWNGPEARARNLSKTFKCCTRKQDKCERGASAGYCSYRAAPLGRCAQKLRLVNLAALAWD